MGKFSRDKGALFEREVVTLARTYDLKAQRVPLSGATEYARGDVEIADGDLEHVPVAEPGEDCICLAATDAPLRFKAMIPRLAQPFMRI